MKDFILKYVLDLFFVVAYFNKTIQLGNPRLFHLHLKICFIYVFYFQVKLVNIRNDDITDGNPKLTLGLIWTIILHFQVRALPVLSCSACVALCFLAD